LADPVGGRSSPGALRLTVPAAVAAVAVLLCGCSDGAGDEAQAEPTATSSEEQITSSTIATANADSGVGGTINASGGVVDLGGVPIRHESGVVVTLEQLLVEPSYVVLEFSAANGSPGEVALAGDTVRGITLEFDDPTVVMTYQAPSINETLELSSGEVLEAEIVFLGVLPENAAALDITFNPAPEADGDVAEPTIRAVDIPMTTVGG